jgi:hypothetical protein
VNLSKESVHHYKNTQALLDDSAVSVPQRKVLQDRTEAGMKSLPTS